jgi:hypothetical protein
MKRTIIFSIVLVGLTPVWASAQGTGSKLKEIKITIPNIRVSKSRKLFVYCLPPPFSKGRISLSNPKKSLWSHLDSEEGTDGVWMRRDFNPPREGWPSKVTAVCTVESDLPVEQVQKETRFFTFVGDGPLNWFDVHESHTFFVVNPVSDRFFQDGTFIYEVPWPSTVVIKIFKWTQDGPETTKIEIKDRAPKKGEWLTKWGKRHKFDSMADGDYQAKITATKVLGKNEKNLRDQANIYMIVQFRRGIN